MARMTTTRPTNPTRRRMRWASSSRSAAWPWPPTRTALAPRAPRERTVRSPPRWRRGPARWRSRRGRSGSPAQRRRQRVDRAVRCARPTAITASEHCRPHPVRRPPIGDQYPTRRLLRSTDPSAPSSVDAGRLRTSTRRVCECRKPLSPFEVGNGDGHSFVSFRRRREMPLLSYRGRTRPAYRPGETFATAPTTGRSGADDHGRRHSAATNWRVIHITQSEISFTRHSVGIVTRSRQRREGGAA